MADHDDNQEKTLKTKLFHFSQAMGVEGMAIRKEFLELAIRSRQEGDPIEIADRFLDYVIGEHVGPRCELLSDEQQPLVNETPKNAH